MSDGLAKGPLRRALRVHMNPLMVTGGVSKVDAVTRVAAMTDTEVAEVYQRFDEVPAGGSDILIIGLVIFAVLEITGYIDVIPEK